MKHERQIAADAAAFARRWEGRGYEKGESQKFWIELLDVLGVEHPTEMLSFEQQAALDHTSFIDVMIPRTRVMIEQKSLGRDLRKGIRQSDGSLLSPFQQAQRYMTVLPVSQHPRWIVCCNFAEFDVYDMENPKGEPSRILLKDLGREYYRLQFLVDTGNEHLQREMEVSMKAGDLVGQIYDLLIKQYIDPTREESLESLNILCVRLVFCLYAEDAGVFGRHDMFHDYLARYETEDLRNALIRLFKVLDTKPEDRDPYLKADLAAFPYTNGGLFSREDIEIPQFTDELRTLLLQKASLDFDWSEISPTIFGGVFESTLNPETRRSGGMHYTSIENIHKVIDPLFLDDLRRELDDILQVPEVKPRLRQLHEYQDRLARLTFFDPACGSGNFLTETYLSLRRLENRAIKAIYSVEPLDAFHSPIKVSIHQFYGIEINDFAVTVATTALWISEAQTMAETERIVSRDIDFLPLKSYANIKEGNALRLDWGLPPAPSPSLTPSPSPMGEGSDVSCFSNIGAGQTTPLPIRGGVGGEALGGAGGEAFHYDYIIGNPPFVGYAFQSRSQKDDLREVCPECGKNIDYVAGWYYKAMQLMQGTKTKAALVSTNSITQGEQVAAIWKNLIERYGMEIIFAHRTFRWDSEANIKAHVHCVVVGFQSKDNQSTEKKRIYEDQKVTEADNINPYLLAAPNIFIERRTSPLCDVPPFVRGCQPTDDGNLILTAEEKDELLKAEPQAAPFIRPFMMGKDFIQRKPRYCLWLVGANPHLLSQCKHVLQRVAKVKEFRLSSKKAATRAKADTPTLFDEIRDPKTQYIALPTVSSERRKYIPMEYLSPEIIPGNKLYYMQDATLYHFGILESNVHMAWMRAVCGRLEMRYNYSNTIVYNNFPWPSPTAEQQQKIEQTAQAILDARSLYPDSSLADLYDELTMPPELRRAHQDNDRAVMAAYGFSTKMTESDCVAQLFRMYEAMAKK